MKEKIDFSSENSPNFFTSKSDGQQIRHLNNMPWIGAIGVIVFALIGITYTFILRQKANAVIVEDKKLLLVDETPLPIRP
ncbi:hypothetical protein [Bartonella bilalgolemii]|uniref:Uncharacterized protein n=1 Tax=Bartonella bilalgolemii TaxID=2942911 RepID=A0ABT0PB59_9HYPH|nr:hypothetical protein [Bartonella sp. G70]MCL6230337.1 hypothetical protein [Bartonella sp. G70]